MSRHRVWTLALSALAACSSATSPADPSDPPPTTKVPAPVNIAGEWIDTAGMATTQSVSIWHVTQSGSTVVVTDSAYSQGANGWAYQPCLALGSTTPLPICQDTATLYGDTLVFSNCEDCYIDTAYVGSTAISFPSLLGDPTYVRGTWSPPAASNVLTASDTLLHGIWVSDSVQWQISDPSCVGVIQYGLVLPPPFDNDSSFYQGYVYARLCGATTWTQWTQNLGQEVDSLLTFGQIQPVPGPSIFASWWLKAMAPDTLANLTPADSVHNAWMPAHFYRVASLPGGTGTAAVRSSRGIRSTQQRSPSMKTRP
jgi:hypothetical protein